MSGFQFRTKTHGNIFKSNCSSGRWARARTAPFSQAASHEGCFQVPIAFPDSEKGIFFFPSICTYAVPYIHSRKGPDRNKSKK